MKRIISLFILVILLLVGIYTPGNILAQPLAQETIRVRIQIPVMQEMQIIEPVALNLEDYRSQLAEANPLVVEDLGKINVRSNAPWVLQVENLQQTDYQLYLRRNGYNENWQQVSSFKGEFNGEIGTHSLSWDVKIDGWSETAENEQVDLIFTIAQD